MSYDAVVAKLAASLSLREKEGGDIALGIHVTKCDIYFFIQKLTAWSGCEGLGIGFEFSRDGKLISVGHVSEVGPPSEFLDQTAAEEVERRNNLPSPMPDIRPLRSPNKPPLQTPASGTPAAEAPVAPPPGAAGR